MSKILIIEDEVSIADLERDYLEVSGYEVETCYNGTEGLDRAVSGNYDLIILDIMLPGIDGFEICKKLRETKDVPVIIVSAKKDDVDKVTGLGLGADDYMTKPFSPSEMVARVKAHLARFDRLTNKPTTEIIDAHGLHIDKAQHIVTVDGKEVTFTAKEFELLSFLASNPNRVFAKNELYRQIWGMDPIQEDLATVTVHIKKIREKLNDTTTNPLYIETIWGVGYKFR